MTPRPDTEDLQEAETVQIGGEQMQRLLDDLDFSEEAATVIYSSETMQGVFDEAVLDDEASECIFDEDSLASAAAMEATADARVVDEAQPAPLRRMPSRADLVDRNRGAYTEDSTPRSAPSRIPWLVAGAALILAAATLVAAAL